MGTREGEIVRAASGLVAATGSLSRAISPYSLQLSFFDNARQGVRERYTHSMKIPFQKKEESLQSNITRLTHHYGFGMEFLQILKDPLIFYFLPKLLYFLFSQINRLIYFLDIRAQ